MRFPAFFLYLVCSVFLSACNTEYLDLQFALSINEEQVFSSQSSIEEIQAMPGGTDPEYTQTNYPIILVHGLYGFDNIFIIDYWYRIIEALELGGAEVYTSPVPKLNSTEYRGEYLINSLEEMQAITGKNRFHLMGHSHGGPTVRYVLNVRPDLVASVTTIGGVNAYGVDYIDEVIGNFEGFIYGAIGQGMLNALAELIEWAGGNEQNHQSFALASFRSLSAEGTRKYNQSYPIGLPANWDEPDFVDNFCLDGSGDPIHGLEIYTDPDSFDIPLFSWSGIGIGTNVLDPSDILIEFAHEQLNNGPGDGFVDRCASHFGHVIRSDYDLDHIDQINHAYAMRRATATSPLSIYRMIANKLKEDHGL